MSGTAGDVFYWNDWQGKPALRLCSLAAQGLWMRYLCIAAQSPKKGYVLIDEGRKPTDEEVASIAGCTAEEVTRHTAELDQRRVCSRDRNGVIYSRKMVRDSKKRAAAVKGGKIGGQVTYQNKKGIFASQDDGQEGGQGEPQLPYPLPIPVPVPKEEDSPSKGLTGFAAFYDAYPRKVGKAHAAKAYGTARVKVPEETILTGAKAYAAERRGEPEKFTKHPSTWLNGECWNDYQPAPGSKPANGNGTSVSDEGWRKIVGGFKRIGVYGIDGPRPGEPGCAAPEHILREFGYEPA